MTTASSTFSSCSSNRQPYAPGSRQLQGPGWNEPSSDSCHTIRPRPARRRRRSLIQNSATRRATGPWMSGHSWLFVVLFSILMCCQHAEAGKTHGSRRLTKKTSLHFDKREVPEPRLRLKPRKEHHEANKHDDGKAQDNNNGTLNTAPSLVPNSLPHPFDSSLGNNFTAPSCPVFFQSFLNSDSFNECLPFSLLLQTSSGFFAATQSPPRLKQTLDATCNVDYAKCSSLMANLANEIQSDSNCGADFSLGNPVVAQAYTGLIAYQPSYHAGCLTDSDGKYCFANAVTNSSAPTSSYIYYLPLGVQLPGGTQPTCDTCLQKTMSMFASYATNSSQPLSMDYGSAAQQVDMTCGPSFAASAAVSTGAAPAISARSALSLLTTTIVASVILF